MRNNCTCFTCEMLTNIANIQKLMSEQIEKEIEQRRVHEEYLKFFVKQDGEGLSNG